jgi:hypothetical protein
MFDDDERQSMARAAMIGATLTAAERWLTREAELWLQAEAECGDDETDGRGELLGPAPEW